MGGHVARMGEKRNTCRLLVGMAEVGGQYFDGGMG
jgi:hypothetical protein